MEAVINVIGKNDLLISENINHLAGLRGQHSGEVAHIFRIDVVQAKARAQTARAEE